MSGVQLLGDVFTTKMDGNDYILVRKNRGYTTEDGYGRITFGFQLKPWNYVLADGESLVPTKFVQDYSMFFTDEVITNLYKFQNMSFFIYDRIDLATLKGQRWTTFRHTI